MGYRFRAFRVFRGWIINWRNVDNEPRTMRKTRNGFINCPSCVPSADVSCHAVHGESGIRNLTYHQTRLAPSAIFLFNKPKSSSVPSDSPILLFKNFSPCPPSTPVKNRSPYPSYVPSRDSDSLVQFPVFMFFVVLYSVT